MDHGAHATTRADGSAERELEDLVFECLERIEREGEGVVDELCASHPSLAATLRQRIDALRDSGLIEPSSPGGGVGLEIEGYALLECLDRAPPGSVYRARAPDGRATLLRIVRREAFADAAALERFEEDCRAARTLEHPAIVPLLDFGRSAACSFAVAADTGDTPLAEVLARIGSRSPETLGAADLHAALSGPGSSVPRLERGWVDLCVASIGEVAAALAFAHARGLAHGALSTRSIEFAPNGAVRVSQWGCAELEGRAPQLAAPAYKSPERRAGRAHGASVLDDVFALGVVLHEMLALRLPTEQRRTWLQRWRGGALHEPLSRRNACVEAALEAFVASAIDPRRSRRPRSMSEFSERLAVARGGGVGHAPTLRGWRRWLGRAR